MTDVAGVLEDDGKLIPELNSNEALKMIENGTIKGGFVPKIHTCIETLKNVKAVAIVNGKTRFSLLFELFSDKGSGTLIRV
jgi:acetylglutamate kinase